MIDGIVVAKEYQDVLLDAWNAVSYFIPYSRLVIVKSYKSIHFFLLFFLDSLNFALLD